MLINCFLNTSLKKSRKLRCDGQNQTRIWLAAGMYDVTAQDLHYTGFYTKFLIIIYVICFIECGKELEDKEQFNR